MENLQAPWVGRTPEEYGEIEGFRSPTRTYTVTVAHVYTIEVEAQDEEEAKELAVYYVDQGDEDYEVEVEI